MDNPQISVIMSTYNGDLWLKNSVDSVLNQSSEEFEFIIINDGSTDTTSSILKSYNDERIIIIDQENIGLAKSLNVGLNLAKGKYIARIDADDICEPNRFEMQKQFLECNQEIALVGSDVIMINDKGNCIGYYKYPTSHEKLTERLYNFKSVFPHSSIFFRKEIIKAEKGYNEKFIRSQDFDLYLRISKKNKIASINEPLIRLRMNIYGPTYSDDNQLLFGLIALICHYRREAGLKDYSKNNYNSNEWQLFLFNVKEGLSNNGMNDLHRFKCEFAILRKQLKQGTILGPIKSIISNISSIQTLLFRRNLFKNIPSDLEKFIDKYENNNGNIN